MSITERARRSLFDKIVIEAKKYSAEDLDEEAWKTFSEGQPLLIRYVLPETGALVATISYLWGETAANVTLTVQEHSGDLDQIYAVSLIRNEAIGLAGVLQQHIEPEPLNELTDRIEGLARSVKCHGLAPKDFSVAALADDGGHYINIQWEQMDEEEGTISRICLTLEIASDSQVERGCPKVKEELSQYHGPMSLEDAALQAEAVQRVVALVGQVKALVGVATLSNQVNTLLAEKLYGADPGCEHEIVTQMSGVKCRKCSGWFCY